VVGNAHGRPRGRLLYLLGAGDELGYARSVQGPVDVFISYVPEDDDLRDELEEHLALLKRDGVIRAWHQRLLGAGSDVRAVTGERLRSARVVC